MEQRKVYLYVYIYTELWSHTSTDEHHFVQYKKKIPLQPKQIFVADKLFFHNPTLVSINPSFRIYNIYMYKKIWIMLSQMAINMAGQRNQFAPKIMLN